MIKRDKYLNQLISAQKNGFPKIITGIRRCGKSFLLKEIYREYLINSGVNENKIIILELDDDRNIKYRDPIVLGEYIREQCKGEGEFFVFIDEVQKVYKILNPVLTEGKHILAKEDDEEKKEYLKNLFQTTYFSDIVERNHLKKGEALDELCNIISSSTGSLLNADKIAKTFVSVRHEKIDRATVESYMEYFKDAFLLREAKRYDLKGRKEIGALRKYYFCDTGLRNARLNFAYPDEGQMLENIVYNELCYNGYTVNVGAFDTVEKDKNGKSVRKTNEVDFYATKWVRSYYIQVIADISNADTWTREVRPYIMLNDQVQKVLVINKPINETRDEQGFTIIGISDFLLRFIK